MDFVVNFHERLVDFEKNSSLGDMIGTIVQTKLY